MIKVNLEIQNIGDGLRTGRQTIFRLILKSMDGAKLLKVYYHGTNGRTNVSLLNTPVQATRYRPNFRQIPQH